MPQEIPVEASETLAFTPASLEHLPDKDRPVFMLRSPTSRAKRFYRRLLREEGLVSHDKEEMRAEMLRGLETLWSPEAYAEHSPRLKTWWERQDQFALQLKDDPTLEWDGDPDEDAAIGALVEAVTRAHKPLRDIGADNADTAEMAPLLLVAVTVEGWDGLGIEPVIARGYLTVDSAEAARDALAAVEKKHKLVDTEGKPKGMAYRELFIAASQRMYLEEDEEKNSASPSPSGSDQQSSSTDSDPGKSPAPASKPTASKKTRADA